MTIKSFHFYLLIDADVKYRIELQGHYFHAETVHLANLLSTTGSKVDTTTTDDEY